MKTATILTAGASLLSGVSAGMHRMKLQKVPLEEQLSGGQDFSTQAKALGQKYMGVHPSRHQEEIFKDTAIHTEDGHLVPVSNFLNAQCTSSRCRLRTFD